MVLASCFSPTERRTSTSTCPDRERAREREREREREVTDSADKDTQNNTFVVETFARSATRHAS